MKVLVIDDDPLVRFLVSKLLTSHGYDLATAEDGQQGFAHLTDKEPALVITDLIMPGQDGIETIHRLKQERPDIPIIAISGGGRICNIDMLPMARLMGADAIITKPFDPDELVALVQRLCATISHANQAA